MARLVLAGSARSDARADTTLSEGCDMTGHAHTVLLTATVPIAPAARPQFLAAVRRLIDTAAGEQDVLGYTVAEDVTAPGRFAFVERYRDTTALHRHQSTPACQDYLAGLPRWLAAAAVGHVQRAETLDAIRIDAAREGQPRYERIT